MNWTEERVLKLKELWGSGLTAQEIADKLGGVTRNAVIGKANRLKLSKLKSEAIVESNTEAKATKKVASESQTANVKETSARSKGNLMINIKNLTAEGDIEEPDPLNLALLDLSENTCKWPVNNPNRDDYCFCGVATFSSGPYCKYHSVKAFNVSRGRSRRNA